MISNKDKKYYNTSVLWRNCRMPMVFEFSFLNVVLKTRTQKSRKKNIFLGPIFQIHLDQFFDQNLNCLSVQTEANKSGVNLTNVRAPEALKRQIADT